MKSIKILLILISICCVTVSCGMAAKKVVETTMGGTGNVQWIKPFEPIKQYDTIVVTPTENGMGDLLPANVRELVSPALKSGLAKKVDTPKKTIVFKAAADKGEIQLDSEIVYFDQKLDDRVLVIRGKLYDPQTQYEYAVLNIVARVSGARSTQEIVKGFKDGVVKAANEIKQTVTED